MNPEEFEDEILKLLKATAGYYEKTLARDNSVIRVIA